MRRLLVVGTALLTLLGYVMDLHADESETFTGNAARSGTFNRPLLDVDGKRYELEPSDIAEASVRDFLTKFSEGDTGTYVIKGTRCTVKGNDGIIIDSITPATAKPSPERRSTKVRPIDASSAAAHDANAAPTSSGIAVVRTFPGNKGPGWKQTIEVAGAVGQGHVVDFDVASFVVHDKVTGKVLRKLSSHEIWKQVEPAGQLVPQANSNDARIIYDPLSERWFACAAGTTEPECFLAVSSSSNPLKTWRGSKLPLPRINPYMKLGVDRNGLYVCSCNGHPEMSKGLNCYVLPKQDAISDSGPLLTRAETFTELQFSTMPAIDPDPDKPADAPFALLSNEFFDGTCSELYMYKVTWSDGKASISESLTIPLGRNYLTPNNSTPRMEAFQPDPGPKLRAGGGGRRLDSVFVRNGSVFGCNGAKRSKDSRPGVLWYEVRISDGALLQEGFVDSPDRDYIYPSIAVDSHGNIGVGCTGTSQTEFPSVYVMMHGANDPSGTMRNPVRAVPGTTAYHYEGQRAVNWSHYSATCIDPAHRSLLWTVQAYGNSKVDREWCTAWAAFQFEQQQARR